LLDLQSFALLGRSKSFTKMAFFNTFPR